MLPVAQNQLSTVLTGGQLDIQVLLEDPNGNWVDLTALLGRDWVLSIEYSSDIDESVSGGSIVLSKSDAFRSLSPLVTDDQISATFGDLIRAPTRAKLIIDGQEAAYWMVSEFNIDPASVTLHVADYLPSLLANRWIAQDVVYGEGMDMGEVAQRIINYAFGALGTANPLREPTIDATAGLAYHNSVTKFSYLCTSSGSHSDSGSGWPTTPGTTFTRGSATFKVLEPIPQIYVPTPIAEAIGAEVILSPGNPLGLLEEVAGQIGYVLRQRFVSGEWRLTIEEPEREGTSSVLTLGPDTYEALTDISHAHADVRNAIEVFYRSGTDRDSEQVGHIKSITKYDATSIDKYGYRYASIGNDDAVLISSSAQATKLADAALADLKDPVASITIRTPLLYPVEVGDIVTLLADGQDLSSNHECSVLAVSHALSADDLSSEIKLKLGKPIAGVRRWSNRIKVPGTVPVPQVVPVPTNVAATPGVRSATISWEQSGAVDSQGRVRVTGCEVHVGATSGFTPGPSTLKHLGKSPYVLNLNPGTEVFVKVRAKDIAGNLSAPTNAVSVTALGIPGSDLEEGSIPTKALLTPPAENLIPNGYSEAGAKAIGLSPEGTNLIHDPINSLTGEYCRRLTTSGGTDEHIWAEVPATPDKSINFTFRAKGIPAVVNVYARIVWLDASGSEVLVDQSGGATASSVYSTYSVTAAAPAGATTARFVTRTIGSPAGRNLYMDCAEARRAITADLIEANTLKTSNYAEDPITGVPSAGAKLDHQGTALKVASGSVQVGQFTLADAYWRALEALGENITPGANKGIFWRGNNEGRPDMSTVTLHYNFSLGTAGRVFDLRIAPSAEGQNLDAIRMAEIVMYEVQGARNTGAGVPFIDYGGGGNAQGTPSNSVYVHPVPRGYGGEHNISRTSFVVHANIPHNDTYYRLCFRIRLFTTDGTTGWVWYYPPASGSTYLSTTGQLWAGGTAGGGGIGGGGGGPCVDPATPVLMLGGDYMPAGEIKPGDYVWTSPEDAPTTTIGAYLVTHASTHHAEERYRLTTEDGREVVCSRNHRFRDSSGNWVYVQDILPGMILDRWENAQTPVVASVEPAEPGPVVKLTVDRAHTYYTSGILSHNWKPRDF